MVESPSVNSSDSQSPSPSSPSSSSSVPCQEYFVLPTIVFAQFAGTSLWFAPNAVVSQIEGFGDTQVATLVSCVQIGFILGTLSLTYFAATDRIIPAILFTVMALVGATLNFICVFSKSFIIWAILRLLVGICLAGVYPVGMKIAAMEYPNGLGARLGVLVGALTLGTAFPWFVKGIGDGEKELPVVTTLASVSILAVVGAISMAVIMIPRQIGNGGGCAVWNKKSTQGSSTSSSIQRKGSTPDTDVENREIDEEGADENDTTNYDPNSSLDEGNPTNSAPLTGIDAFKALTSDSRYRASALGYFGHMWELYALWAYIPILVEAHANDSDYGDAVLNVALTTFLTIGIGAISCSLGGYWSLYAGRNVLPGSAVVAEASLLVSGTCCLLAPLYKRMSPAVFFIYMMIWGFAVVSDSAQFSSLSATYAHKRLVGTALTLTTCIGFSITVVSIQVIGALLDSGVDPGFALSVLAIGPILGIYRTMREWPLHHLLQAKKDSTIEKNEEET